MLIFNESKHFDRLKYLIVLLVFLVLATCIKWKGGFLAEEKKTEVYYIMVWSYTPFICIYTCATHFKQQKRFISESGDSLENKELYNKDTNHLDVHYWNIAVCTWCFKLSLERFYYMSTKGYSHHTLYTILLLCAANNENKRVICLHTNSSRRNIPMVVFFHK